MDVNDLVEASRRGAEVDLLYRRNYDLMLGIACRKFGVPREEAESLVNEVFVTFLGSTRIHDERAWLIGAICNASRAYNRASDRRDGIALPLPGEPTHSSGLDDALLTRITVRETISRLHEKCQKTLRLHYWEGRSASEMATALDTTNRYAEKLIHKCLRRASQIYRQLIGRDE